MVAEGTFGLLAKEAPPSWVWSFLVPLPIQLLTSHQEGPTAGRAEPKGFGKDIPGTALAHGPPGGRPLPPLPGVCVFSGMALERGSKSSKCALIDGEQGREARAKKGPAAW